MNGELFFKKLNTMKDLNYFNSIISYLISPIITGVKPSSIINIFDNDRNMLSTWNTSGESFLSNLTLNSLCIKHTADKETVLIYNKKYITSLLKCPNVRSLLSNYSYSNLDDIDIALAHLHNRLNDTSFPHEVGIFLGIPTQDVEGFIKCSKPCLLSGYWKVYSDIEYAKKIFKLYDESKNLAADCILHGRNILDISNNFSQQILNQ